MVSYQNIHFYIALNVVIALKNYCNSKSCQSFTLLKATAKNRKLFAITSKSGGKKRKELILKIKQRRLKAITLEEAVEKYSILLSQHWKKEQSDMYLAFLRHQ